MQTLAENPHLKTLLAKEGLSIDPKIRDGLLILNSESIHVGDIRLDGTVVGFSVVENSCVRAYNRLNTLAIIYDESKEGQLSALTVLDCISPI